MIKSSFLAPVPYMHLDSAIEILQEKPFVLFGTEAFEFFRNVEEGARVLIYRSHEDIGPIYYQGIYRGYVSDPSEMKRLERNGFRPETTSGESWGMYWKCSDIQLLPHPIPLEQIQMVSRKYMKKYPRGPVGILS